MKNDLKAVANTEEETKGRSLGNAENAGMEYRYHRKALVDRYVTPLEYAAVELSAEDCSCSGGKSRWSREVIESRK